MTSIVYNAAEIRKKIYKRDRGRCQSCMKYAPDGDAHHCYFRSQRPEWIAEEWNLEWTCRDCHNQIHNGNAQLKFLAQERAEQRRMNHEGT